MSDSDSDFVPKQKKTKPKQQSSMHEHMGPLPPPLYPSLGQPAMFKALGRDRFRPAPYASFAVELLTPVPNDRRGREWEGTIPGRGDRWHQTSSRRMSHSMAASIPLTSPADVSRTTPLASLPGDDSPAHASFPPPVFDADSLLAGIDMSDWLAPDEPMPPLPQLPELIDEDDWPDEMPWAWQDSYSEEELDKPRSSQ